MELRDQCLVRLAGLMVGRSTEDRGFDSLVVVPVVQKGRVNRIVAHLAEVGGAVEVVEQTIEEDRKVLIEGLVEGSQREVVVGDWHKEAAAVVVVVGTSDVWMVADGSGTVAGIEDVP